MNLFYEISLLSIQRNSKKSNISIKDKREMKDFTKDKPKK